MRSPLPIAIPRPSPPNEAPLYAEAVRGLRAWRYAVDDSGAVRLHSPVCHAGDPWPVGEWVRAREHRISLPWPSDLAHPAPARGCLCGIHALRSPEALLRQYGFAIYVLGEVELAGRVFEHEGGWRAERARVSAVFAWDRPFLDLTRRARVKAAGEATAATYGVPLVRLDVEQPNHCADPHKR